MDYQKIYDRLIQHRIQNKLEKCGDGSIESHHITPKCLGGTDDIQNIVNLSCREHYVAHLLLAQIYKNTKYFEPLIFAICCMQKSNGHNKRFVSSRIFHQERIAASKRNLQKIAAKRSIKITWRNETHTIKEWAKILNIPRGTITRKHWQGLSMDEIIKSKRRCKFIEFNGRKLTLK